MRVLSSPESIRESIPTVLALFETFLAMSLSIFLAVHFGTLLHIAIGAAVAPLLLMRSQKSIEKGKRWFEMGFPGKQSSDQLLSQFIVHIWLLVWAILVKLIATLAHPLDGLRQISNNWYRVICCTDTASPIEFVPETGSVEKVLKNVCYSQQQSIGFFVLAMIFCISFLVLSAWAAYKWLSEAWAYSIISFLAPILITLIAIFWIGLLCYIVGYIYRLSLKSTALIWLPLLYVTRVTFDETLSVRAQVRDLKSSALWRLLRLLSWATIVLVCIKILVLPGVIDWWNSLHWAHVLNVYVMPDQIHTWHVAAFANALIALLGYYLFIDRADHYINDGKWTELRVSQGLKIFRFTRGVLSIYTISVGFYLTIVAASRMQWPQWSGQWFPW